MGIALHMRLAAVLLLTLAAQGQPPPNNETNALRSGQSSQGANQNTSPQPLTQPSAQQVPNQNVQPQMPVQSSTPCIAANSPSTEPKESFSQLALFLFASGTAFFIALLAWSDQIRGINQDIRELEKRFLDGTGIEKRTFLRIVKPESPDDRGSALLEVVGAGRIKNKDAAEVLQIFTKWNKQWSGIESLSAWKYYMTIALTIVLFVVGVASLTTNSSQQVKVLSIQCKVEMLLLIPLAMLVALILVIIICIAKRENGLRSLLKSVSDMV
jgi:hypothetical protein